MFGGCMDGWMDGKEGREERRVGEWMDGQRNHLETAFPP